jgi:membrane fusion protein (multidrug efflux system)
MMREKNMADVTVRLGARLAILAAAICSSPVADAQPGPLTGSPKVAVIDVRRHPITDSSEFMGRVESPERVDIVARVPAVLEKKLFEEGAEVKKGDLLYRLDKDQLEAAFEIQQANLTQAEAQAENATVTFNRANELLQKGAGTQVSYDSALAALRTATAQLRSARALLRQSELTLGYTEIRSPIDGRIGRTSVTVGNVVGNSSGSSSSGSQAGNTSSSSSTSQGSSSSSSAGQSSSGSSGSTVLATVVSQDPMYVAFPVSVRAALELRNLYSERGGPNGVQIKLRLPDGSIYGETGRLDFIDVNIAQDTDTILMRATIANPPLDAGTGTRNVRELTNNEFVTVVVESVQPTMQLAVPRTSVLSDQQGDFVYVVDAQNTARQRRVRLGQSTPEQASVVEGLAEGDRVVTDGIQRVKPGAAVDPSVKVTSEQIPSRDRS